MFRHLSVYQFIFLMTLWSVSLFCVQDNRTEITKVFKSYADVVNASDFALLFNQLHTISDITYSSDIALSENEFFYLLGFKSGESINWKDVLQGLHSFFKKNKFETITVSYEQTAVRSAFHFKFSSFWTFERLKIHGFFVGKDAYKQHYLMSVGERFDEHKHKKSLEKIKDMCQKEGYFKTNVYDHLDRNNQLKGVVVNVHIERGNKFSLQHRDCIVQSDASLSAHECLEIKHYLTRHFLQRLHGASYSKQRLCKAVQAMKKALAQKGFFNVSVALSETFDKKAERVGLAWHINVHNKREFIFFGNSFFSKQELFETIADFGRSAWLLPTTILAEEIVQNYKHKGFLDVVIDVRDEKTRSFFVIKEGARVVIEQVQLKNASSFDPRKLIHDFFAPLKKRRFFDHDLMQRSSADLVAFYYQHGFLDARIAGHELLAGKQAHKRKLIVSIDEGVQYVVGSVRVNGLDVVLDSELFDIKEQQSFDPTLIARQRQWLVEQLRQQGYPQATAHSSITKSGNSVHISWRIQSCEHPDSFGKTIVLGVSPRPIEHVKSAFFCKDGALWNQNLLRKSFTFLNGLEVFDTIQITPDFSQKNGQKDLLITLKEDESFEMRLRGGIELQHVKQYQTLAGITYRIGGSFFVKNPFKYADLFRFDADITRAHREIIASYIRPLFFNTPVLSTSKIYSIKHDQPGFVGSNRNIYTVIQNGCLVGLEKKAQHFDASCNVGFEWAKTSIKDDSLTTQHMADALACAIDFNPALVGESIPFFFVEPTMFIDRLDNKIDPHCGTLTLVSFKGMFPLGGQKPRSFFIKMLFEQSVFAPIKKAVLAVRFRFGHIFHQTFSSIMPNERFYLGGAHSLRGYETDLVPPVSVFIDPWGQERVVPRGGKSMFNINAEIRAPLSSNLGIVLFQDAGILSGDDFADFKARNLLAASGFGIRYKTPLGPLRFDIGWKWDTNISLLRSFSWFLSFGHAF